jgi:hypothetical protein
MGNLTPLFLGGLPDYSWWAGTMTFVWLAVVGLMVYLFWDSYGMRTTAEKVGMPFVFAFLVGGVAFLFYIAVWQILSVMDLV